MESSYHSEESEESGLIEVNSAHSVKPRIKWKLLSYNTRIISVHLQESHIEEVKDLKSSKWVDDKTETRLPQIFWDTKKEIKGLGTEEIEEKILCSISDNNNKVHQSMLKKADPI